MGYPRARAEDILESLTRVIAPGFGINVVDLGLVYGVESKDGVATITMTLPSPAYSSRDALLYSVDQRIRQRHDDIRSVVVDLVWDPPWREDFITAEGELQMQAPIDPGATGDMVNGEHVMDSLHLVIDPEIGLNIVDLGLVYDVDVEDSRATVTMTLTTPGCPLHASIESAISRVLEARHPALSDVVIDLVWEPPWDRDMITEAGRAQLGWH
jgi:metal-sulfur cluster biosynthetic enzyme